MRHGGGVCAGVLGARFRLVDPLEAIEVPDDAEADGAKNSAERLPRVSGGVSPARYRSRPILPDIPTGRRSRDLRRWCRRSCWVASWQYYRPERPRIRTSLPRNSRRQRGLAMLYRADEDETADVAERPAKRTRKSTAGEITERQLISIFTAERHQYLMRETLSANSTAAQSDGASAVQRLASNQYRTRQ